MAVCLLAATSVPAQPRITFRCVNAAACNVAGTLIVRAEDGSTPRQFRVENSAAQLAGASPPLRAQLAFEGPGFWMRPERITSTEDTAPPIPVWRTTTVRGRFELRPPASELPKRLSVAAETPPGAPGATIPSGTSFDCTVSENGSWQCTLPAATLDLVIRAKGFTPHYAWDVKLKTEGPTDLGTIQLKQGSSLVAWLDSRTVRSLKAPARGTLVRMTMAPSPALGDRLNRPVAEAIFNQRGMLQLAPVPAGTYTLEVAAPGFATARLDQVTVYERSESRLRTAIRLEPPLAMRLSFVPPRDPSGAFWHVSVARADPLTLHRATVASATATNGVLELAGQAPGHYTVAVTDAAGNRYANQEMDIHNDADARRTISIELLNAKGRVTLAGTPIEADLVFGGRNGAERVAVHADDEGRFVVMLPHSGKWSVQVEHKPQVLSVVTVLVNETKDIDIDLADTEIAGWLTGLAGERVANAEVILQGPAGAVNSRTAADGTFSFRGVSTGKFSLHASDPRSRLRTRFYEIAVSSGLHRNDIELVLQNTRTVKGTVISKGQPVVGARVSAYAVGTGMPLGRRAVTGLDGGFELELPGEPTQVVLITGAAGRTMQAFTTTPDDRPVTLDVASTGGVLRLRMSGGNPGVAYNGIPIPLVELFEWARAQDRSLTPGAYLDVRNLAPGMYRFCRRQNGTDACDDGILAHGATLVLGDH